ncbi:MAG: hypothetical protein FJW36_14390 [Acidobacteria bacterium]|nr:hypothetical protein [Acidobacteriota bacterium]
MFQLQGVAQFGVTESNRSQNEKLGVSLGDRGENHANSILFELRIEEFIGCRMVAEDPHEARVLLKVLLTSQLVEAEPQSSST